MSTMRVGGLVAMICCLALGSACMTVAPAAPTLARLQVIAEPDNAVVQVDGAYFGAARVLAAQPKPLSKGMHYVTIEAAGYFPHDVELEAVPGTTTLRISLRKIPE